MTDSVKISKYGDLDLKRVKSELSKDELKIFERTAKYMISLNILASTDLDILIDYSKIYLYIIELRNKIKEEGLLLTRESQRAGVTTISQIANPLLTQLTTALNLKKSYQIEMGLTSTSKSKVTKYDKNVTDGLSEFTL